MASNTHPVVKRAGLALCLLAGALGLSAAPAEEAPKDPLPTGCLLRVGVQKSRQDGVFFAIASAPRGKHLAIGSLTPPFRTWDENGKEVARYGGIRELDLLSLLLALWRVHRLRRVRWYGPPLECEDREATLRQDRPPEGRSVYDRCSRLLARREGAGLRRHGRNHPAVGRAVGQENPHPRGAHLLRHVPCFLARWEEARLGWMG